MGVGAGSKFMKAVALLPGMSDLGLGEGLGTWGRGCIGLADTGVGTRGGAVSASQYS